MCMRVCLYVCVLMYIYAMHVGVCVGVFLRQTDWKLIPKMIYRIYVQFIVQDQIKTSLKGISICIDCIDKCEITFLNRLA